MPYSSESPAISLFFARIAGLSLFLFTYGVYAAFNVSLFSHLPRTQPDLLAPVMVLFAGGTSAAWGFWHLWRFKRLSIDALFLAVNAFVAAIAATALTGTLLLSLP